MMIAKMLAKVEKLLSVQNKMSIPIFHIKIGEKIDQNAEINTDLIPC